MQKRAKKKKKKGEATVPESEYITLCKNCTPKGYYVSVPKLEKSKRPDLIARGGFLKQKKKRKKRKKRPQTNRLASRTRIRRRRQERPQTKVVF
jgi:hypothetical protein